jgi:hypothetical protein
VVVLDALGKAIDTFTVSHDDPDELLAAFVLFDRFRARLTRAVGEFDASGGWELDGATSMTAWLRFHARQSGATAGGFVGQARRLRSLPVTEALAVDGALSADQIRVIVANVSPRTQALFAEIEPDLVPVLAGLDLAATVAVMRDRARHADAIIDERAPRETVQAASLVQDFDESWHLTAHPPTHRRRDRPRRLASRPVRRRRRRTTPLVRTPPRRRLGGRVPLVPRPPHRTPGTRLACDAAVHRVLTNGRNHILDYGTSTRVVSPALFHALVLRDRHCRFPGCDRTPDWSEAHHIIPVPAHGPTRQHNPVLLCSRHHHRCHQPNWHTTLHPDATLTITTPTGRTLTSTPRPLINPHQPALVGVSAGR